MCDPFSLPSVVDQKRPMVLHMAQFATITIKSASFDLNFEEKVIFWFIQTLISTSKRKLSFGLFKQSRARKKSFTYLQFKVGNIK
jgi:hypothetical protein